MPASPEHEHHTDTTAPNLQPDAIRAKPVLVTGATGYVGGRLVPKLLDAGYTVRAVGRSAAKLTNRPWGTHPNLQIAEANVLDVHELAEAAEGCGAAYWLVHSMNPSTDDFAQTDRDAAYNMVIAAKWHDIDRIIYLSGLGEDNDPDLSHHLQSRHEVSRILSLAPCPVTTLRAAMILGSGSASFELLRWLTERLPVMLTPAWVRTRSQPIAISNVLGYLAGLLEHPETSGETYDIGGPDVLTYEDLFRLYADIAGLKNRLLIPVPLLSPQLSALWIDLITPLPAALARPLIEGLKNEVVCHDFRIRDIIPQDLLSCREAIELAVQRVAENAVDTCWHDAGHATPFEWATCGDAKWAGGEILESAHTATVDGPPEQVWPVITALGGERGYYFGDWLWEIRGLMDTLVGGPGLRRGRRDHETLQPGDALDFWRVIEIDEPKHLVLQAEMKVPGEALLDFTLQPEEQPDGATHTQIIMRARFLPRGILGTTYWHAVFPLHSYVFNGMLNGIAQAANCGVTCKPTEIK